MRERQHSDQLSLRHGLQEIRENNTSLEMQIRNGAMEIQGLKRHRDNVSSIYTRHLLAQFLIKLN